MVEGGLVVVEKAQGDPSRQPFRLGEAGAFNLPMVTGELVGRGDIPLGQCLSYDGRPLYPPQLKMSKIKGQFLQNLLGIVPVMPPPPA